MEKQCHRSLSDDAVKLGPDSAAFAQTAHNVAHLLFGLGKPAESAALLRKVLVLRKRLFGSDSEHTLATKCELALALRKQGHLREAESLLRKAFKRCSTLFGDSHRLTLWAANDWGIVLAEQVTYKPLISQLDEAAQILSTTQRLRMETLGDMHPDTLASFLAMASVMSKQGKRDKAEMWLQRACLGFRQVVGYRDPRTLNAEHDLAVLFSNDGRLTDAVSMLRKVSADRSSVLGELHSDTLASSHELALVLRRVAESNAGSDAEIDADPAALLHASNKARDEAFELMTWVYETRMKVLGWHADTLKSVECLADITLSRADLNAAEPLLLKALELHERLSGEQNPALASTLTQLADVCTKLGKLADAEHHLERAQALYQLASGQPIVQLAAPEARKEPRPSALLREWDFFLSHYQARNVHSCARLRVRRRARMRAPVCVR